MVLIYKILLLEIKEINNYVQVTLIMVMFTKTTIKEMHNLMKNLMEIQTIHFNSTQNSGKYFKYSFNETLFPYKQKQNNRLYFYLYL